MYSPDHTIAAISSAAGAAARMIIRLSGSRAAELAAPFWSEGLPQPSSAARGTLLVHDLRIPAWLYRFQNPASYTGEDLVEFHIPGNPLLAKLLLQGLIVAGARLAEPGEFTARAYFNGKLDLAEAEGVAATIAASNEQELSAARSLLAGELARRLAPVMDLLAGTLALLEVGIDFSDEDVTFLSADDLRERIERADGLLRQLLADSVRFERLAHEPTVVLAGRPNAGKSTLLNALAGWQRAVVSPVAGTTRDVLMAQIALPRGLIQLIDVAGLEGRHPPGMSEDSAKNVATGSGDLPSARLIEWQMERHARRALEEADHLILVRDATDPRPALALSRTPDLVVRSKADLIEDAAVGAPAPGTCSDVIDLSAKTGQGLDALRQALDGICFGASTGGARLALNARHVRAIEEASAALCRAGEKTSAGAELLALDLREALEALGQVLGRLTPDDLLGKIFSSFCIGK